MSFIMSIDFKTVCNTLSVIALGISIKQFSKLSFLADWVGKLQYSNKSDCGEQVNLFEMNRT